VRISTTDTLLNGLLLPALRPLMALHPHLQLDVSASNELVNLSRREADIAVRATRRPPPHLVGRELGPIRVALFAAKPRTRGKAAAIDPASAPWLAVDDALPEHPSVRWRIKHLPQVTPRILVNSIQSVLEGIVAGVGIGIVPLFLAQPRADLVALSEPLDECETTLWLLTHPESRHLRRISTVATHLAGAITLR
jgi:DNA-binding transcriptional LysR family regulator